MPTKLVWLFAAIAIIPSPAKAGIDVTFQFELQVPTSNTDAESLKLGSVEIQDRIWATPGVEQASLPLMSAKPFDFTTRFHFHFDGDGPYWLDNVCFPLTRQLFHQCERYPNFSVVLCDCDGACIHTQETPLPYGLQR
jgi:hypothetical protein